MTRTIYKAGCVGVCLWLVSSSASAGIKASGGELRILDGQYAVHTFTNSSRMVIKEGGLIVEYVINSNLTAGTLVYGQAHNFELDLFSDYEIEVSKDYKFGNGLLAIRGDAQIGGDVVVNEGFVVATVGTTTGA